MTQEGALSTKRVLPKRALVAAFVVIAVVWVLACGALYAGDAATAGNICAVHGEDTGSGRISRAAL